MFAEALFALTLAAPWERAGSEKGFDIEKRKAEGTKLFEVRVSGNVDLPPKAIFDVLWDVKSQAKFAPHLKRLDVLEEAADSVIVYEQVDVPAVTDRDYTLRLRRLTDDATQLYQVMAENADAKGPPPRADHVRMTKIWSIFSIEPADRGSFISYHSFGDPAGDIPAWLSNAAATKGPLDFVVAIVNEAKKRNHR